MNSYPIPTTLARPYDVAVETVREALGEQGFGILTEIDLKATRSPSSTSTSPRR